MEYLRKREELFLSGAKKVFLFGEVNWKEAMMVRCLPPMLPFYRIVRWEGVVETSF